MALSESIEYDRIEVVGPYKGVQVRKATVIKKMVLKSQELIIDIV